MRRGQRLELYSGAIGTVWFGDKNPTLERFLRSYRERGSKCTLIPRNPLSSPDLQSPLYLIPEPQRMKNLSAFNKIFGKRIADKVAFRVVLVALACVTLRAAATSHLFNDKPDDLGGPTPVTLGPANAIQWNGVDTDVTFTSPSKPPATAFPTVQSVRGASELGFAIGTSFAMASQAANVSRSTPLSIVPESLSPSTRTSTGPGDISLQEPSEGGIAGSKPPKFLPSAALSGAIAVSSSAATTTPPPSETTSAVVTTSVPAREQAVVVSAFVPEASSFALFIGGLGLFGMVRWRSSMLYC